MLEYGTRVTHPLGAPRENPESQDYQRNKREKQKTLGRTGHIIYKEFYPRKAKTIIDEIDRVLAKHHGFTDAKLDFIINIVKDTAWVMPCLRIMRRGGVAGSA